MRPLLLALATLSLGLAGCKTPVGVRRTGFESVYRGSSTNVLEARLLSRVSQDNLASLGLLDDYRDEPARVIAELEATNQVVRARELQVTLAELSYHRALRRSDRGRFLASAVHAYLYLFGESFEEPPNPYSPRFRLACDLYNRALTQALLEPSGEIAVEEVDFETPNGTVTIRTARPGFPWRDDVFSSFLPADAYEVRGLRERVRDPGLGIPLIAVQPPEEAPPSAWHVDREVKLPATAFLQLHGGLDEFLRGRLEGSLELHLASDVPSVRVGQQSVALESDVTAPFAHSLEGSRLWRFEIRGFRKGATEDLHAGVYMLQPYQQGKIPLLLIHGTASSPATWAQTINGLSVDRRLRSRYQIWLALYNTGNPIAYSAALLRDELLELHDELDPGGEDAALSNMVIVGHSQGGLIARLLVSDSGDRVWNSLVDEPFETYAMEPEMRDILGKTSFFEPLPFVRRAVFISTPHRGSFVAHGVIGKLGSALVELPSSLITAQGGLAERAELPEELREIPTSVDQMDPDHPFVRAVAELPFGEGVRLHSIIAVRPGKKPVEQGDDGVVAYASAHLEGVDSELVVRHRHSCQGEPEAIDELRRILLEHYPATRPVVPDAHSSPRSPGR